MMGTNALRGPSPRPYVPLTYQRYLVLFFIKAPTTAEAGLCAARAGLKPCRSYFLPGGSLFRGIHHTPQSW